MYKSIVNEVTNCEYLDIKVRSNEGDEVVLQLKPDEKFVNVKQEIWKSIGPKTQMKIGDAIIDIMTEYIQSTELSYDAFCSLPETEQVKIIFVKMLTCVTIFWFQCCKRKINKLNVHNCSSNTSIMLNITIKTILILTSG